MVVPLLEDKRKNRPKWRFRTSEIHYPIGLLYSLKNFMDIVVHNSLADISAEQWNAMLADNNPFMRHEFLFGLESTGCVSLETGWESAHIAIYENSCREHLLAAMPCYIKGHSYGEYIFDWSWADAHHRYGLEYYPKLSNAVPFTPATGDRLLVRDPQQREELESALFSKAIELCQSRSLSSFHSLFVEQQQAEKLRKLGCLTRHSSQFHWRNKDYQNFDDFLAIMSSKKRKNIKRERRRVAETGITYRWLSESQLDQTAVDTMYRFYARTIQHYGAQSYLNKAFFEYLAQHFSQQTLFLFAEFDNQVIAGGLYFKSDNALFGRYWGALDNFHSVHFETCYYQAIEWCINNGYQRFEAGAQGQHKLARGLEPSITYSSHWIAHDGFRQAIDDFICSEQEHMKNYQTQMNNHSPFKAEI
jgi:predicted N-acyltransferase